MKARILDQQVKVYSSMDANSLSIATLQKGSEVEFGGTKKKSGKQWVPITLSTGQQAFIPGETKIWIIREGMLMENSVDLHSEPSAGSLIKQQLKRKTKVSILEVVKEADKNWVKVRDESGNEGFIDGETRLRLVAQRTKAGGRKNIINGALWVVAGAVMLYSELTSTAGGGFGILGIFALVFGLVQLVSGIVQFIKAPA